MRCPYWRESSCERFCKVPSTENYCWSKIGNGVITLLWQPRCHCNPDHDKFSVLIQLWWQFFQMCVYGDVVYAQTWYWPWKKCIEPPSYASTAYVVAIRPSFLFEKFPVHLWSRLFQGFHHSANYTICIYIETRGNHQILSRSQAARAFYCKMARHCIVGNNNAATHNKLYTCHKSTAWAPTAQGTRAKRGNAIPDWHLTSETGNGLCESLNNGPFI